MVLLCAFSVEILTIWKAEALMSVFWLYQYYSRCFSSFSLHIQFFPPSFPILQLFLLSLFFHKCPVPSILLMVPRSFFFCFYSWIHDHGMKGLNCVCACVCVCAQSFSLFATPWTIAHQAPLSVELSRSRFLLRGILEQVTISFSRGSSWPKIEPTSLALPALAASLSHHHCHLGTPKVYIPYFNPLTTFMNYRYRLGIVLNI